MIWLAIETMIIWFLYPETKGPTLEELGRLFEDETVDNKWGREKAHTDGPIHVETRSRQE